MINFNIRLLKNTGKNQFSFAENISKLLNKIITIMLMFQALL